MFKDANLNGIILVDKPKGWSSFDVVRFAKKKLNFKKIGHAGTLDPMAEGLLILLLGKATKKFDELLGHGKEYWAKITLGQETDTYDGEGVVTKKHVGKIRLTEKKVINTLKKFEGEQEQTPPIFSALKLGGEALYKKARRGEKVDVKKRKVVISRIELVRLEAPDLYIKVDCSSGTYIRSLAFDIGRALGYGAYLSGLKRVRIGEFNLKNAVVPDKISEKVLLDI